MVIRLDGPKDQDDTFTARHMARLFHVRGLAEICCWTDSGRSQTYTAGNIWNLHEIAFRIQWTNSKAFKPIILWLSCFSVICGPICYPNSLWLYGSWRRVLQLGYVCGGPARSRRPRECVGFIVVCDTCYRLVETKWSLTRVLTVKPYGLDNFYLQDASGLSFQPSRCLRVPPLPVMCRRWPCRDFTANPPRLQKVTLKSEANKCSKMTSIWAPKAS